MALITRRCLKGTFLFECDTTLSIYLLWGLLDLVVLNCLRYCYVSAFHIMDCLYLIIGIYLIRHCLNILLLF